MTKHEIFEIWAPSSSIWSDWVKPVLFACMDPAATWAAEPAAVPEVRIPLDPQTALVIDLPASLGVQVGMLAARSGYRPVPLYNALPPPQVLGFPRTPAAVPNVTSIMHALMDAAPGLSTLSLHPHSPPAFLLDANRRGSAYGKPAPGQFDNRSVSFTTDFPSANYLSVHGITKALLVQLETLQPQTDLAHTLLKWQQDGIAIFALALNNPGAVLPIQVSKPSSFGKVWHRVLLALGLRRDLLGGFGGIVPEPSSG